MIKTAIKHKILESCINTFFTKVSDNFTSVKPPIPAFFKEEGIEPYLEHGVWKATGAYKMDSVHFTLYPEGWFISGYTSYDNKTKLVATYPKELSMKVKII